MTDKTKDLETSGADVKVTAPAMPNAANYTAAKYGDAKTAKKAWIVDKKVWDDAEWLLTHPKTTRVKGTDPDYSKLTWNDLPKRFLMLPLAEQIEEMEGEARYYRNGLARTEAILASKPI